jgi:formyl-CoA transferase
VLQAKLARIDGRRLTETLLEEGVPCGPVLEIPDVAAHPHTLHRQMVVERDGYRGFGIPVKLARTPGAITSIPRDFGADTRAVLTEAGYDSDAIDTLIDQGAALDRRR